MTLKLSEDVSGHIFEFRRLSPPVGTNLSMLGHPLGNSVSLTQGRILLKIRRNGVPLIYVNLLGAEGASGSALVDDGGRVVGILQVGLGSKDVLGERTSGVVAGINLSAWFGSGPAAKINLCHAYPNGGIPDCPLPVTPKPTPTPTPTPAPAPSYSIKSCWVQHTAGSWVNVTSASATTALAASDMLVRGPDNFWSIVELTAVAPTTISGVKVSLVNPYGVRSSPSTFDWTAGSAQGNTALGWKNNVSGMYFFVDPVFPPPQRWFFLWQFPNGQSCDAPFTVTP